MQCGHCAGVNPLMCPALLHLDTQGRRKTCKPACRERVAARGQVQAACAGQGDEKNVGGGAGVRGGPGTGPEQML